MIARTVSFLGIQYSVEKHFGSIILSLFMHSLKKVWRYPAVIYLVKEEDQYTSTL